MNEAIDTEIDWGDMSPETGSTAKQNGNETAEELTIDYGEGEEIDFGIELEDVDMSAIMVEGGGEEREEVMEDEVANDGKHQ